MGGGVVHYVDTEIHKTKTTKGREERKVIEESEREGRKKERKEKGEREN